METKVTHAYENERYTKWKTSHKDTAPKQDILEMDDAQNGETPKTRVEHTELNKILEKINAKMATSAFLQSTMALITPRKHTQVEKGDATRVKNIHDGLFHHGKI